MKLNKGQLLICFSILLVSCKSGKDLVSYERPENKSTKYIIEQLEAHQLEVPLFKTKASIQYSDAKNKESFRANIRIKRDSLVWVSFSKGPVPVGRFLGSPDSIKTIIDIKKSYFLGTYSYFSQEYNANIDYGLLEDLLLGNIMLDPEHKYKAGIDSSYYLLSNLNKSRLKDLERGSLTTKDSLVQRFWIDPITFKVNRINIIDYRLDVEMDVYYSDFTDVEGELIPRLIHTLIKNGESYIDLRLEYSKIRINKSVSFPFNVPEDYERVHLNYKQ